MKRPIKLLLAGGSLLGLSLLSFGGGGSAEEDKNGKPALVYEQTQEVQQEKPLQITDIYRYIESNQNKRQEIIRYGLDLERKQESRYEKSTIDELTNSVGSAIKQEPEYTRDFVLNMTSVALQSRYRDYIFDKLEHRDKAILLVDIIEEHFKNKTETTIDLTTDLLDKIKETKLYKNSTEQLDNLGRNLRRILRRDR